MGGLGAPGGAELWGLFGARGELKLIQIRLEIGPKVLESHGPKVRSHGVAEDATRGGEGVLRPRAPPLEGLGEPCPSRMGVPSRGAARPGSQAVVGLRRWTSDEMGWMSGRGGGLKEGHRELHIALVGHEGHRLQYFFGGILGNKRRQLIL